MIWWLAATLVAALLTRPAFAQLPDLAGRVGDGQIAIEAQTLTYDQNQKTIAASGDVVVRSGETEIRAAEMEVNQATNEVSASGGVTINDPEGMLFADSLHLDLDDETGTLSRASLISANARYSISGDRIDKGMGQQYHIENGKFTTCLCDDGPPSWSIAGEELDVALGGYATVRGGTFNVLDVPVMYLPRAIFPVTKERQSGILVPRFSISSKRGFQMLTPFYWAINRSNNVTIAPDIETGARVGVVGEYRYALSERFSGHISPSYFNEVFRDPKAAAGVGNTKVHDNRWSVLAEHTNGLGPATAYADLFLVGDDSFLRDINTFTVDRRGEVAIRTLPYTVSRVGIAQVWDRSVLRGQATYYENLVDGTLVCSNFGVPGVPAACDSDDDCNPGVTTGGRCSASDRQSTTLQQAPDLDWWGQWVLSQHLVARMNVTGAAFQRSEGIDGLRLYLRPEAIVPVPIGGGVVGSLRVGFRETAYHLTERQSAAGLSGDEPGNPIMLPRNSTRETVHAVAEVGTSVSRVFDVNRFGIVKVKHTIEPLLEYRFVPGVSQGDLPIFDGVDRDDRRSLFTYGFVSRLLAKYGPQENAPEENAQAEKGATVRSSIRELGRVTLLQSADTERKIGQLNAEGGGDHFSDADLSVQAFPNDALRLRADMGYDTSATNVSEAVVGFRVRTPASDLSSAKSAPLELRNSLGVNYRFITQNLLQQIDGDLQVRVTDMLGLVYAARVDIDANRFLENYYGLRLRSDCDCWGLDLAVVDKSNPKEIEVRVQVTLVGLGSAGRSRSDD